jgi:hypothetical protein
MSMITRLLAHRRLEERRAARRSLATLREAIRRELERSRRYDGRFMIIRAGVSGRATRDELLASVRGAMRSTDTWCVAERHLYVLLPEAERTEAEHAFERMRRATPDQFDSAQVEYAAFPDGGLTMGALLAQLRRASGKRRGAIGAASTAPGTSSATPTP